MLSIMPPPKFKAFDSNGKPLAGGKVYTYIPGTSTPKATFADPNGASANPNPVVLDAKGEATIWLQGFYKIVLTDSNNVQQWSVDQISSSPSVATPNAEWLTVNASFTFVSATQFSLAGDMTGTFQPGRRIQAAVSAGTIYATVTAAVYSGGVTTVTVAPDSGPLDSGLTAVNVGLLAALNPSIPIPAVGPASAMPWVDARAYSTLSAAIAAIGTAQKALLVPNTQNITASLTVPSNVTLKFMQGGMLNVPAGVTVTINGPVEAGLYRIFTLNGTGASVLFGTLTYDTFGTSVSFNQLVGSNVKEAYPQWFGAVGDGVADDTAAIQNLINAATAQYWTNNQMNFYVEQKQVPLVFPKGIYLVTATLDLSFRNDLKIINAGGARIKWGGANDGTIVELKCSSRTVLRDLLIDGNLSAGTFIHHSGNGTSEAGSTHDLKTGKGAVSYNHYHNVQFEKQYAGSAKAMLDTNPYPADSSYAYYYGMDDSAFFHPRFVSGGTNGFALAGAQAIIMYSPEFNVYNGIHFISGGGSYLTLYSPIFTLQGDGFGAMYADDNTHIGNIEVYNGYLEGTTKPLFSYAAGASTGSIKKLALFGGLYSEKSGNAAFISVPSGIPGSIYMDGARNQSSTAGMTLKVDAASCYVSINSGSIDELNGSTTYTDKGFSVTNALFTNLDKFHSRTLSGRVGNGAASIAASTAKDVMRVDITVPAYRKLYLNLATFQLANTDATADLRLRAVCSQSGFTWTSSTYYGDGVLPNFLLYDNSAGNAPFTAQVIVQIYNNDGAAVHTPQDYDGWSLMLDNR